MDVGFILFAPAIVLLAGFRAPFFMLAICLVAVVVVAAVPKLRDPFGWWASRWLTQRDYL